MSYFYIAAAHKSSGKTTLSVGLAAALHKKGLKVQTFKKGPDYIDPLWLEKASLQPCYNLDFNTMTNSEILQTFERHRKGQDICLIEGNKGLYDGVDLEGADSNAAMAKLLGAPVILVLDCSGITRGIAPLLKGYKDFDHSITIAGVILNKVASPRHEQKLRDVIDHYVNIPVIGAIRRDNSLFAEERHLGLIPPDETVGQSRRLSVLSDLVERNIDLQAVEKIAEKVLLPSNLSTNVKETNPEISFEGLRIGIMRDSAFGFYYADDLDRFRSYGANLIFINAMKDKALPALDGLFIGGGFPETHLEQLENNISLRDDIRQKGEGGLPIYAECGGLMYLSRSISWHGKTAKMVGLLQGDVVMHERPQGRGLVKLKEQNSLWGQDQSCVVQCHEFHYASLKNLPEASRFAYKVQRGHGITGEQDGIVVHNIQANFSHLRHSGQKPWVAEFLGFVAQIKAVVLD